MMNFNSREKFNDRKGKDSDLNRLSTSKSQQEKGSGRPKYDELDLVPLDVKEEQGFVEGGGFKPLKKGMNLEDLDTHSGWETFGEEPEEDDQDNEDQDYQDELLFREFREQEEIEHKEEMARLKEESILDGLLIEDEIADSKTPHKIKGRKSGVPQKSNYDGEAVGQEKHREHRAKSSRHLWIAFTNWLQETDEKYYEEYKKYIATHQINPSPEQDVWKGHIFQKFKEWRKQGLDRNKIREYMEEQNRNRNDEIIDDGIELEESRKFYKSLLDDDNEKAA